MVQFKKEKEIYSDHGALEDGYKDLEVDSIQDSGAVANTKNQINTWKATSNNLQQKDT